MAYLKPPAFQRQVFNRMAMRFGIGGSRTLTVRGRRTGADVSVPVIPIDYAGGRYIVSTRGEAQWVRNLRASGECSISGRDGTTRYRAAEVAVEDRAPILDAYRERAGRTVSGYFKQLPGPQDHPVFRLEPLDR